MFEGSSFIHGDVSLNGYSEEIKQLYDTSCAIKSQQIILKDFGIDYTEEQLVQYSTEQGWYNGEGTQPQDVGKILADAGIPCTQTAHANVFNLVNELAQGHKIIVGVDSNELWHNENYVEKKLNWLSDFFGGSANHALIVAGIDTSDPNNVLVVVKDPGTGDDGKAYPLSQFMDAWADSSCFMVSTDCAVPTDVEGMENFDVETGHIDTVAGVPFTDFQVFNDLSFGVPVLAPIADGSWLFPMNSLVSAYHDFSIQSGFDFSNIFIPGNYLFNDFLDPGIVTPCLQNTFNTGLEQINFTPDNNWAHFAEMNHLPMMTNSNYEDFLNYSIGNFINTGDYQSANLCDQQLMMLDYCDNFNLDFGQTFFPPIDIVL